MIFNFIYGFRNAKFRFIYFGNIKTRFNFATEAGLKYFVLGAFSSCLLILGIAIIYSFTGLLTFFWIEFVYSAIVWKRVFYQGFL